VDGEAGKVRARLSTVLFSAQRTITRNVEESAIKNGEGGVRTVRNIEENFREEG
jgi:hypothetical protein